MQFIKTTVVLAILAGVGYGVHVVLKRPPLPNSDGLWAEGPNVQLPSFDLGSQPEVAAAPPAAVGSLATAPPTPVQASVSAPQPGTTAPAPWPPTLPSQPSPLAPPPDAMVGQATPPLAEIAPTYPEPPTAVPPSTLVAAGDAAPAAAATSPSAPATPAASLATPASVPPPFVPAISADPPLSGADPAVSAVGMEVAPASHMAMPATTFDDAWQSAQSKIQNGQLADALLTLSLVYSDHGLLDTQRDRLITLLDQLAGSVVYSCEHLLEHPYTVAAGDTWESIGTAYGVPGAFLARVNGRPEEMPPPVGESLKVVRGPFRGELHLQRRELTLFLGRYYAGRFDVGIGRDLPAQATLLDVVEKQGMRPYQDPRSGQSVLAGAPENPYGQHWIGLRDAADQSNPNLGIHSVGSGIDAADTRGCITVCDRDADDLKAILSLGSKIAVVR